MTDIAKTVEAGTETAPTLDQFAGKPQLAFAQLLPRVAAEYGKSLGSQVKDFLSYCMRGNKLTVDEYYHMRLFDDEAYSIDDKKAFVGLQKSRELWGKFLSVNNFTGLIEDKLAFEILMRGIGINTTKTIAVIGGHYPDGPITKIGDADALREFLSTAVFPIFGKPIHSNQSLGSARLAAYDAKTDSVVLANGSHTSVSQLWSEIQNNFDGGYLFQDCVEAHPFFQKMCRGGLPTIRIVTLDRGHGPEPYRCAAKLTGDGNVADNFWRAGNLLAAVDPQTGMLGPALTQMGIDGEFVTSHPASGEPIEGQHVPCWDEIVKAAIDTARLLQGVAMLGFDVALSSEGPIVVEANSDPHLIMMQVAHRKGVLDTHMNEALAHVSNVKSAKLASIKAHLAQERADAKSDIKKAVSTKAA